MNTAWFVPWGWLHRPRSPAGVLVSIAALVYAIQVFVAIDGRTHSVSDTLYAVYPHWAVTFLGWDWIARRTAGDTNG